MINKVILIGRLGADPELRYTATGSAVANMSVATTRVWFDKDKQEKKEQTDWHKLVCWGKQAETCKEYLSKGRLIYVEGRLQTRKYQDRDGSDRWTTEVVVEQVKFLPSGNGKDAARDGQPAGGGGSSDSRGSSSGGGQRRSGAPETSTDPADYDFSDIPF